MHRIAPLALASAVALTGLTGCGSHPQFKGTFDYGNLMHDNAGLAARARILPLVKDRARVAGLQLVTEAEDLLVFRTQAPDWMGTDADGASVERADTRRINVEVRMDNHYRTYRYSATVSGPEPGGFTPEARAQFGRALLALRDAIEAPFAEEIFGDSGDVMMMH